MNFCALCFATNSLVYNRGRGEIYIFLNLADCSNLTDTDLTWHSWDCKDTCTCKDISNKNCGESVCTLSISDSVKRCSMCVFFLIIFFISAG